MSTCNEGQAVVVVESLRDVLPESVSGTTGRYSPTAPVIWVGPQQVAHGALVRHFLYAVERPDVVERVDTGRETAVETEDLVVDERGKRQVVEQVCKVFPNVGVAVLAEALVVEAVDLSNLTGLVVTTEDRDALRVSDLECHQKSHRLDRKVATVDVVA